MVIPAIILINYSLLLSHTKYPVFNSKKEKKLRKRKKPNILSFVDYMDKMQEFRYQT